MKTYHSDKLGKVTVPDGEGKHTPGPWFAREPLEDHHEFESAVVAVCSDGSEFAVGWARLAPLIGNEYANCRLMAASPELLECLKQTVASLEYWFPRNGDPKGVNSQMMKNARAAIAKATGGNHE